MRPPCLLPPPGTAVLQLASTDCTDVALKDCLSKLQLSVSPYCSVALQPSMPVALDGSYCERQRGVQARGERRRHGAVACNACAHARQQSGRQHGSQRAECACALPPLPPLLHRPA